MEDAVAVSRSDLIVLLEVVMQLDASALEKALDVMDLSDEGFKETMERLNKAAS